MELGAFSISLAVKDLAASRDFYEKLGFEPIGGDGECWQILRNGDHVLGLFQGMFETNIMTFNPGWDQRQGNLDSFTDVRELHAKAKSLGLAPTQDKSIHGDGAGPASFMLTDPDGNCVLIDQHR